MRKDELLKNLIRKDGTYKRMTNASPIRYQGGKSRAVGIITEYLPKETPRKILSPFIGGASLEIAWARLEEVDEVIGCDVHWPLVNFWQVVLSDPNGLADLLHSYPTSVEDYNLLRRKLMDWDRSGLKLSELEAAALYFYNTQLSYGPLYLGWVSRQELKRDKYERRVERLRNFRCPKLKVIHKSFQESLLEYEDYFIYMDPPYLLGYDSTLFKGIYPNQEAYHHKGFPDELLRDMTKEKSKTNQMLISYNDCGTIREWYSSFKMAFPVWQYSYQKGANLAKNTDRDSKEILLWNY